VKTDKLQSTVMQKSFYILRSTFFCSNCCYIVQLPKRKCQNSVLLASCRIVRSCRKYL